MLISYSYNLRTIFGCYIGKLFSGAFGYADDVVLLAPTVTCLNKLYDVCKQYGQEYSKMFKSSQGRIQPLSKVGVHIRVRWGFTSDIP